MLVPPSSRCSGICLPLDAFSLSPLVTAILSIAPVMVPTTEPERLTAMPEHSTLANRVSEAGVSLMPTTGDFGQFFGRRRGRCLPPGETVEGARHLECRGWRRRALWGPR
jgi:hypothetical protein